MPSRERTKLTDIKILQDQCRIQLFAEHMAVVAFVVEEVSYFARKVPASIETQTIPAAPKSLATQHLHLQREILMMKMMHL
jgi:hypothetical protein